MKIFKGFSIKRDKPRVSLVLVFMVVAKYKLITLGGVCILDQRSHTAVQIGVQLEA